MAGDTIDLVSDDEEEHEDVKPIAIAYNSPRQVADSNPSSISNANGSRPGKLSRHFWSAGDYDTACAMPSQGGMDHVRVHPKFLHSNATSHKWALGAIAELLDNSLDEAQNGATFVKVDKVINPRDHSAALAIQDDGGGMGPEQLRRCMSFGYSQKSATAIGQYGNGFKTSTMRLGADVIVFTRSDKEKTQSIGLLSYTFLRQTGRGDIIVPMVDYNISSGFSNPSILLRTNEHDWQENLKTILEWSPYRTEEELLRQFRNVGTHGTKVVIFNLWLNDDGILELDLDSDPQDIQLHGGEGKQDKVLGERQILTQKHIAYKYRYSLRAYSSILYLKLPPNFEIILRGQTVAQYPISADLKFPEYIAYKPQINGITSKEVSTITTIGFAKEAPMVNVHGFSVYHKNRLIMPFWRVFNEGSSRGKGVIGVLEANFIEPAHDKQDFEKTNLLLRLEQRLKQMTLEYWNTHCDKLGYHAPHLKKAPKQIQQLVAPDAPPAQLTLAQLTRSDASARTLPPRASRSETPLTEITRPDTSPPCTSTQVATPQTSDDTACISHKRKADYALQPFSKRQRETPSVEVAKVSDDITKRQSETPSLEVDKVLNEITKLQTRCQELESSKADAEKKVTEMETKSAEYRTLTTEYFHRCTEYEKACEELESKASRYEKRCQELERELEAQQKQYQLKLDIKEMELLDANRKYMKLLQRVDGIKVKEEY